MLATGAKVKEVICEFNLSCYSPDLDRVLKLFQGGFKNKQASDRVRQLSEIRTEVACICIIQCWRVTGQ